MIILHSHLQAQFKNELFHILHINIYWLDKITNEELFKKTDGMNMFLKIKNRRV